MSEPQRASDDENWGRFNLFDPTAWIGPSGVAPRQYPPEHSMADMPDHGIQSMLQHQSQFRDLEDQRFDTSPMEFLDIAEHDDPDDYHLAQQMLAAFLAREEQRRLARLHLKATDHKGHLKATVRFLVADLRDERDLDVIKDRLKRDWPEIRDRSKALVRIQVDRVRKRYQG